MLLRAMVRRCSAVPHKSIEQPFALTVTEHLAAPGVPSHLLAILTKGAFDW